MRSDAEKAVNDLNGRVLCGRQIIVKFSNSYVTNYYYIGRGGKYCGNKGYTGR